jgi:signal transduction histidine kinase/PAS domain-containing protein
MHSLLQRQIRRYLADAQAPPSAEGWRRFLAAVNDAYEQSDRDRGMLERALELSSQDTLEANSKLRAAFEALPDVLLRLDHEGKVVDYTIGRTTRLQLHEQVLGKPLREALQWDDATPVEDAIRRVQQTQEIVSVERSLLGTNRGSAYEARVAPLLDDQTIVIIRDISERRRAEAELQEAKEAAEERTRELAALLEISRMVSSTLELRPLLSLALDHLKAAIDYSAATISIFDGDTPVIFDYRGPLPRERLVGLRLPHGSLAAESIQEIVRRRDPMITQDLGGESLLRRLLVGEGLPTDTQIQAHARSQLGVPLIAQGRVIGTLGMVHGTPGFYTERHAQVAALFAQQAAVAIENARLYEETRAKAALEERQRLARELHDSVSQALYGIALNASAATELFDAGPERARGLLGDVLRLAEAGLAEMRALIFELRPESLDQEGLVGALEKQVAAVQARHGLEVHLAAAGEPALAPAAKEALYRVAQEALHNAAKHARARHLELVLEVGEAEVGLVVADDGRGFDPDGEFPGHLGLRSMRERAAALGGTLEIASAPGAGTRLRARVPLAARV